MAVLSEQDERRIIPRWRDSSQTVGTPELAPLPLFAPRDFGTRADLFVEKLIDWQRERTLPFAIDLVGAAIVLDRGREAADAARYILSLDKHAPLGSREIAATLLGKKPPRDDTLALATEAISRNHIHILRSRLATEPRNAIVLVDMARHYAIIGVKDRARNMLERALALAPNNRFVLRSAARFFVHVEDAERARFYLQKSDSLKSDPWLLATDIAVAEVAGRTSRLAKQARSILKAKAHPPDQMTELASAMASLELSAGKTKESKRLFITSLMSPTDNAVAQAEWASRKIASFDVDPRHLKLARSYEARALSSFERRNWKKALEESRQWLLDEPFSSRPAYFGSFVASIALEDFSLAAKIAKEGLNANPDNDGLRNNLAFALASEGLIDEASEEYSKVTGSVEDMSTRIALVATQGLLHFRFGRPELGGQTYERALALAMKARLNDMSAAVLAFWAKEEMLSKTAHAEQVLSRAKQALSRYKNRNDMVLLAEMLGRLRLSRSDISKDR